MKCSVCGSESNADARFCANCGTKLNPGAETLFKSPPAAAASPLPDVGVAASVTPNATNLVPLLLVLAALVVVGYFAYRALMPDASTRGNATTEPPPRTAPPAEAMQSGTGASPSASEPAKSEPAGEQAKGAVPPAVVSKRTVTAEPPAPAAKAPGPARPKPPTRTAAPKRPAVAATAPAPPAMSIPSPEPVAPA